VISGVVRDPLGQPISNMTVGVFRNIYNANGRNGFATGCTVTTDDRGQYRLAIAPGYLWVAASPRTNTPGTPEKTGNGHSIRALSTGDRRTPYDHPR